MDKLADELGFELYVYYNAKDAATSDVRANMRIGWGPHRPEYRLGERLASIARRRLRQERGNEGTS